MSGFFAAGTWWDTTPDDADRIMAAAKRLADAGIDQSLKEAQLLWAAAAGKSNNILPASIEPSAPADFATLLQRRCAREPLSHIVGFRAFYQHHFHVSADVLDPRPETETLIEAALAVPFTSVIDLGTGSGCILLSLLAAREQANGLGTDISADALTVAACNVEALGLSDRASLRQSNWYDGVDGKVDLIVSNPPYIALKEMADLQPEVRDHEPRLALTDEGDGLACYRVITAGARAHLKPGGHLMVEIGPTQAAAVSAMMAAEGFAQIRVVQDLDGRDRVVSAQNIAK